MVHKRGEVVHIYSMDTGYFLEGDESLSCILRLATAIALYIHAEKYACHVIFDEVLAHPDAKLTRESYTIAMLSDEAAEMYAESDKNVVKAIQHEAKLTCQEGRWSAVLHILGLSTVIEHPIQSLYPEHNIALRPLFHRLVKPLSSGRPQLICILWSRDGSLDNRSGVFTHQIILLRSKKMIRFWKMMTSHGSFWMKRGFFFGRSKATSHSGRQPTYNWW